VVLLNQSITIRQVPATCLHECNQGQLIPGLASSWSNDEDFTVWTFNLRPDVYFHDGTLMTADAVYKSLSVAFGKPTPFSKDMIANMEVVSEYSIKFTLNQSYRPFPSLLSVIMQLRSWHLLPSASSIELKP